MSQYSGPVTKGDKRNVQAWTDKAHLFSVIRGLSFCFYSTSGFKVTDQALSASVTVKRLQLHLYLSTGLPTASAVFFIAPVFESLRALEFFAERI